MMALIETLLLVAVPVLFWKLRKLSRRLAELEAIVAGRAVPVAVPQAAAGVAQSVEAGSAPEPAPVPAPAAGTATIPTAIDAPGPWQVARDRPVPPLPPQPPPSPPVLAGRIAALVGWLVANWVYAVAAVSLIFAGVYLVQYGAERGLLPPGARVLAALALGLALIGAGEVIRRRWGDGADRSTAYLSSTFSGAGIVALFIGVFAAHQLYGLIGAETAFAGFVAVAAAALVLGWFHGPFLAAIGLIGAGATPFAVGGGAGVPEWLPFYYALLTATGLGIDTMRRWAWVSVLALIIGLGGLLLLAGAGGDQTALALAAVMIPPLVMAIPARSLWPDQQGATLLEAMQQRLRPGFPVMLAGGAMLAVVAMLVQWPNAGMVALACLAVLAALSAIWAMGAPALSDLVAIPAAGFVLRLAAETQGWPLWRQIRAQDITARAPESSAPTTLGVIVGLALAGSLAAAFRSLRGNDHPQFWAALAALFAPVTVLVLELLWQPALVLGPGFWAAHVIGLAAVMVFLSERLARADGGPAARSAYSVLAALSLIALALFVVLTKTALTLALAVLLVTAAALDRRLRLPEMGWFIQAAIAVIGWRLVVDPGVSWGMGAPLGEVVLAYGGVAIGAAAAWGMLQGSSRPAPKLALESAGLGAVVLLADLLVSRGISRLGDVPDHAMVALMALPWVVAMFAQLHRRNGDSGWLRVLRMVLALLAGCIGVGALLLVATVLNPALGFYRGGPVRGIVGLSSLTLAYAVPGALLLFGAGWITMPRILSLVLKTLGGALLALWVALEIRHFWHGTDLSGRVLQGELYSYTVALLLAGAALLYLAIARGAEKLRRVAMGVIALTVAKVFLIDASGLAGLTRVASFLGLGLSLAGLAWLNRWTAQKGPAGPVKPQG